MGPFILAHDLGTTGAKAALYDAQGRLLKTAFVAYPTSYPRPNWVEQDPEAWWRAFQAATKEILESSEVAPADVAVVAFSGQMQGCVPVDSDGKPVRSALIWADQRATEEASQLAQAVGDERFYRITGHRASATYTAAKIMWIRRNQPEVYRRTAAFLQAKDFVALRLTGQMVTDLSDASGTNLLDLEARAWSSELLEASGIAREKLPELRPSSDVVGRVTRDAATTTGLVAGTPVVIGGGDGVCATVGAGVVRAGQAYTYLGSSGWIAMASQRPVYDTRRRTFNFVHLDPSLISPCGTMQAAGASYAWARDALGATEVRFAGELGLSPYELLNLEAEAVPAGAEGLLFLPYLLGERSPYWNPNARGCFIGLRPTHGRRHLVRSVLEGVALHLRTILSVFREHVRIEEMRIIGGGARGALWRQIIADVFDMPVLTPHNVEAATSLGAAVAGGVGVGLFRSFDVARDLSSIAERHEPRPAEAGFYNRWYEVFLKAYEGLIPTFDQLAATAMGTEDSCVAPARSFDHANR